MVRRPTDSLDELLALDQEDPEIDTLQEIVTADLLGDLQEDLPETCEVPALLRRRRGPVGRPAARSPSPDEPGGERLATGVWDAIEDLPDESPDAEESHIIGGRYRLVEGIAMGGMGAVFKVVHRRLGKHFALKLIHATMARDERMKKFFLREARVLSQLDHPGIVEVTDFGRDPLHGAFLVMELLEGGTLYQVLRHEHRLSAQRSLTIALQMADALRYMHEHDLVHCDIKPENVFLARVRCGHRSYLVSKLIDFGLTRSRAQGAQLDASEIAGTPQYASPEQLLGRAPDPSMDIYSVGAVLYTMLTGRPPSTGSTLEALQEKLDGPPPAPSTVVDTPLGSRLDELVLRTLAPEPGDRPADMSRLVYELRTMMDMLGVNSKAPSGDYGQPVSHRPPVRVESSGALARRCTLPVVELSPDGRVSEVSPAFCRLLKSSRGKLRGKTLVQTRLGNVYPVIDSEVERAVRERKPLRKKLSYQTDDGEPVQMLLWIVPKLGASGAVTALWGSLTPL